MRTTHPDPRPTRPRARALPRWPLAAVVLAPLLLASCADDVTAKCPGLKHPEVLTVAAAGNPCAARASEQHVLAWYSQGGVRYPLRCGHHDPASWGHLHMRDDSPSPGAIGHGDPINDPEFSAEIAATLAHGVEAPQGGGNWRYTVRYNDAQAACHNAWGFRVVLAKQPMQADGHPAGIA